METIKYYYSEPINDTRVVVIGQTWYAKYIRTKKYPRMTICSILNRDTNTLRIGWSICSAKDKFVKEVGRQIAYERAKNNPNKVLTVGKDFNEACSREIRDQIFIDFYEKVVGSLFERCVF